MEKEELMLAIRAALEAGAAIMNVYTDPNADFEIERKADNSPLTIADKRSNEVIMRRLSTLPYPVLSEEGKAIPAEKRMGWKNLWVVDPLDGTKEFIKRNGEFTVNIAFVSEGKPETGVIYIPVREELYFADKTVGAYKVEHITASDANETFESLLARAHRLPYAEDTSDDTFIIVASRSHLSAETGQYISQMEQKYPKVETVSRGSSLKLCLIAEGKADVYPRFAPTMEWDTAAGHAIVRASGGEVYQAEHPDTPLLYNKEDLLNPWFIAYPKKRKS